MDVRIVEDVTTEPVALSLVKDFCRIDPDYAGEDGTLTILQASARELLEGFLNLSLAPKKIEIQYPGGFLRMPYGPHGDIDSVKDSDGDIVDTSDYSITGLDFKNIETGCSGFSFFYPMGNVESPIIEPIGASYRSGYNIIVNVGYTSETLQSGLKHLILRLVDYMYQNRGSVVVDLPEDIRRDSIRFSRNTVL